ncbi:MAG TPA: hypothetical protein VIK04_09135 [Solirubrobacteraceae bacterium]
MSSVARTTALLAIVVTAAFWAAPPPASAVSPGGVLCSLTGFVSGALGKLCTVATHAGRVLSAGQKLAGGHLGGALGALTGAGGGVKRAATTAIGLAAIATAVVVGAHFALKATAGVIADTTTPNLRSTWFSAFYWRMAAVSALLTVPFLFAAAIQAMIRSDLGLLARAAFGYLPLGLLAVGIAAPLTMLLLAGSDEMSAIVSSASGNAGLAFLDRAGGAGGAISAVSGDLFVTFFIALLTTAATITLWVELLIRQAAVYVIVLMLPLFFAALVWPARRIWAARAVETLVALILSKFAIVSVLALGGAALGHTVLPGLASDLSGATLVLLAAFTPWALLRLLPLHELAGAAAGGLSAGRRGVIPSLGGADAASDRVGQPAEEPQQLRAAMETSSGTSGRGTSGNGAGGNGAGGDTSGAAGTSARVATGGTRAAADASDPDRAGSPILAAPAAGAGASAPAGTAVTGAVARPADAAEDEPAGGHGPVPGPLGAPRRSWRTLDLHDDHDLLDDHPLVDDAPVVDESLEADDD